MKKNKKQLIVASIFVIVLSFVLIGVRNSFSISAPGMAITCPSSVNVGKTATCTLKGAVPSGTNTDSIQTTLSASNLEIVSVTKLGNWQDMDYGSKTNLKYFLMNKTVTGEFNIASIVVKGNSAGTGNLSATGSKIYPENYPNDPVMNVSDTSASIRVNTPTPTPTPPTTPTTPTKTATKSNNNYLSSLSLSQGKIAFSKTKTSYSVTVGASVSSVRVSAKLAHSKASFAAGYNPRTVNLGYGKNTVKIITVAENGAKRTYTIYITRSKGSNNKTTNKSGNSKAGNKSSKSSSSKSSNNKLKTLYLSDGIINFKSNKYAYDVEVNNGVDVITVEGEAENSKAKVKGLGKHDLKVGANTIKIIVTAENGDEKTYTLRINRKSKDSSEDLDSNNYLKDLSITGYEFDFDKNKEDYDINRDGRESLKIKAVTESKSAKVTIQGNERLADGDEIQIIVTAEDGSNRTYTITVHDSNNIMYTAIGIFIIGLLSVIVVIAYKNKKANQE